MKTEQNENPTDSNTVRIFLPCGKKKGERLHHSGEYSPTPISVIIRIYV